MPLMTIGEAANAAGVSAKAIRLWEARGLIPATRRTRAGYRLFSEMDVAMLRFIRQAKRLGLTLDEIREIISLQDAGTRPCERVVEMIDGHLARIEAALVELHQLHALLTATKSLPHPLSGGTGESTICHIIEGIDMRPAVSPIDRGRD